MTVTELHHALSNLIARNPTIGDLDIAAMNSNVDPEFYDGDVIEVNYEYGVVTLLVDIRQVGSSYELERRDEDNERYPRL